MKRIAISFVIVTATIFLTTGLSSAFFSDTETSTGNILQAGDIDLTIDGADDPVGIVSFEDLKPGDNYIEEKAVRVGSNPAWVWFHIFDVATDQGVQTEPEELEEDGSPQHNINDYLTYDLEADGDVLIASESEIAFNDVVSCWVPLGEVRGGEIVSVNQSFHFPSSVTNWAQGDRMTFSEEWYAEQVRNNPDPAGPPSDTGRVWDSQLGHCVDEEIDPGEPFADAVPSSDGGTFGTPSTLSSNLAIAAPLVTGAPDGQFIQISDNTVMVFEFVDNKAVDGAGDDIRIHIFDALFPATAKIEISDDGLSYHDMGNFSDTADVYLDMNGTLTEVTHIRITDIVDGGGDAFPLLGFDLDALEALNSVATP